MSIAATLAITSLGSAVPAKVSMYTIGRGGGVAALLSNLTVLSERGMRTMSKGCVSACVVIAPGGGDDTSHVTVMPSALSTTWVTATPCPPLPLVPVNTQMTISALKSTSGSSGGGLVLDP